jgi:beta-1,4-mannosyltransferase
MMLRVLAWPAYHRDNPYNWLLYSHLAQCGVSTDEFSPRRLLLGRYDIFHLHWPDYQLSVRRTSSALVRTAYLFALLYWARWRRIRLVWTVHNLHSHEQYHPTIEKWFWQALTQRLDACFSLTFTGRDEIPRRFPALGGKRCFVTPHGHYRGVYRDELSKAQAREKLGVKASAVVGVFLGAIRSYKNVPLLIRTFSQLEGEELVLLVAGRPKPESTAAEIEGLAARDPRIRTHLGFVRDDDIQLYLKAADLMALPFREILNSGSAMLSLSFGCPVLVPQKGAMGELQAYVGDPWVRTYGGELTPAKLRDAFGWALDAGRPDYPDLAAFEWIEIARTTANAYAQIVGATRA